MSTLLIRNARVVTPPGPGPHRGAAQGKLVVLPHADVRIEDGVIHAVGETGTVRDGADEELDADGRVLLPGFVDCHTHLCWGHDRIDEWLERLGGATYQQIAERGGGIMSSVRSVRRTSEEALAALLRWRLDRAVREGTTTIEIKSGYGLTADEELKQLRAIRHAAEGWSGTVVPTALLGHALDPERPRFVEETVGETLDRVHAEFPDAAVDAYCEKGAWSRADTERLLARARSLGHPVRVHADQFTALGMVEAAIALGARSVDHLEASSKTTLRRLGKSETIGVLLPVSGFHVDGRYADGRAVLDAGGAVAVATNANPGTAPSLAMPFAIALAVRHCGLTPAEAITAATANAAAVLGFTDRGWIGRGARADLVLLAHRDERALAWEVGSGAVDEVMVA